MGVHLNPLDFKIVGMLNFKVSSSLHVGGGGEEVRREFLRLPTGELVIPSSTWKGAFRNLSEQLARNNKFSGIAALAAELYSEGRGGVTYRSDREKFDEFTRTFVETLRGNVSTGIDHKELVSTMMELGYTRQELKEVVEKGIDTRDGMARKMAEDYLAIHCPIGRLYGNLTIAGKVRFLDTIFKAATHFRPGVGIERSSNKVKENLLYFIEAVSSGTLLKLTFIADNLVPKTDDSKLFANTLETIGFMGLSIGGRKSAGMGELKLINSNFYVVDLRKDETLAIGNPFKKANKFDWESFTSWLRG